MAEHLERLCLNCKKLIDNPKFCSRSCAASYNNKLYPKRSKEAWFCVTCKEECPSGRMYCLKCLNIHRKCSRIKNPNSRSAKMGWRKLFDDERYRLSKGKALEFMGNKCVLCGATENLEFDHINPKDKKMDISASFNKPKKILYQELNKCQLLCHKCHKEKTVEENSKRMRERYFISKHGKFWTYYGGCRCTLCIGARDKRNILRRKVNQEINNV